MLFFFVFMAVLMAILAMAAIIVDDRYGDIEDGLFDNWDGDYSQ